MTLSLSPGTMPKGNGQGPAVFLVTADERAVDGQSFFGVGQTTCSTLSESATAVVSGLVFGKGPYYVIGALDDFGLGATPSLLPPGSIISLSLHVERIASRPRRRTSRVRADRVQRDGFGRARIRGVPGDTPATDERKRIIARLGEPFPFTDICWRVVERTKDKKRGLVTPYVKVGVLIDRLNSVLGEGCWSRTYQHRTIDNIPVTENNKTVIKGKVALICDIDVPGVGRNSGTGEAWSDDPNAFTSADTQAFKRAAECFGIGLYLRLVEKFWWDIDSYGKPVKMDKFAPPAAERLAAALRRTGTTSLVERASLATRGNHNSSPATGNASRSQTPAQSTTSRTTAQTSLRDELLAKKAEYIASLGESLYTDATAKARSAMYLAPHPSTPPTRSSIRSTRCARC